MTSPKGGGRKVDDLLFLPIDTFSYFPWWSHVCGMKKKAPSLAKCFFP